LNPAHQTNRIFKQRNVDIGVVTQEDALNWGFTGVMVRGSGMAWDLRRAQPYENLQRASISRFRSARTATITIAISAVSRRLREATKIMLQCIALLRKTPGPVMPEHSKFAPPKRAEMKGSMEALIHHFKLYTERLPMCRRAKCMRRSKRQRESSAFILVADGSNRP